MYFYDMIHHDSQDDWRISSIQFILRIQLFIVRQRIQPEFIEI